EPESLAVQLLELPLGVIERIAQCKIDVLVACAIHLQTVGVDLRARHGQIDLYHIGCAAAMTAARSFERHVTLRDPLAIALQPLPELACPRLEGTRMIQVA